MDHVLPNNSCCGPFYACMAASAYLRQRRSLHDIQAMQVYALATSVPLLPPPPHN